MKTLRISTVTLILLSVINFPAVAANLKSTTEGQGQKNFTDTVSGIEFVAVKGGCFQMGDVFGDGMEAERPVHEVCVSDFAIGKYEVTQEQWMKLMKSNC